MDGEPDPEVSAAAADEAPGDGAADEESHGEAVVARVAEAEFVADGAHVEYGDAWRALEGAGRTERTRAILERMRDRHRTHSAMHYEAAELYRTAHRTFTIVIMVVSFATALAVSGVSAEGTLAENWGGFLSGGVLSLVGTLTAINEFLEFQKLEERHRAARAAHRGTANFIGFAVAREADREAGASYDYGAVLDRVAEAHRDIQAIGVDVPGRVLRRHAADDTGDPWTA